MAGAGHIETDALSGHHHGLGFWPPPSSDEKDPLRWPRRAKVLALLSMAFFNFAANFAAAGLSVASVLLGEEFHKTEQQVNALLTYNFLLLGLGNLVWVPLSVKFGKRPVMLISTVTLFAVLIWTAKAKSFNELLIARCISGFVSAAGESILPGIVSDMFFLHERGLMMSIYVILISSGTAVGPLVGGFIVEGGPGKWRDFVWLCAALAGIDLLGIFFLYPESSFTRPPVSATPLSSTKDVGHKSTDEAVGTCDVIENPSHTGQNTHQYSWVVELSYPKVWTSFYRVNPLVNLTKAFILPVLFLLSVPVVWTVFLYGGSLASQIIMIFAFPSLLLAPPYQFASSSVGLMQIAALIGFVIACYGGGYVSDEITARLIIRNHGNFVPEQRLISLIPGCIFAPVGCILLALACQNDLHWAVIAVGFGLVSFGTVYSPNIAMTYLLDCYPAFAQEILVAVNVIKNLVAFLFVYVAVDWVNSQGWIQVYMIMFMVVTLATLLAIPLYFVGGKSRRAFDGVINRLVNREDATST